MIAMTNKIDDERPWTWLFKLMQGRAKDLPKIASVSPDAFVIIQAIETAGAVIAAELANVADAIREGNKSRGGQP